jgi:hypothetical protein
MSQVDTNSTKGDSDKCGRYTPDTLPHPITPTLIFLAAKLNSLACNAKGVRIEAAASAELRFRNSLLVRSILIDFKSGQQIT